MKDRRLKMRFVSLLVTAAVATAASAAGSAMVVDGILTLDGVVTNVTAEADLGSVTNVVLQNGGGVAFDGTLTAAKIYRIAGDGLASTGVVSVAAGKNVTFSGAQLAKGSVGHVLVKRGAGTLYSGSVGAAATASTRFIVEEGRFQCTAGDFWGGHKIANTNCVIDVREGAVYDHGTGHGVVGPVELTGAEFHSRNGAPKYGQWADASLDGGVTAHASERNSYMFFASWGFLGHCNRTNCVFDVEAGARLVVDGSLADGFDSVCGNRLIKRGAGELVLLKPGKWTGGTVLEAGTLTIGDPESLSTGDVTLAGDVTLNVLVGTTFVCPPVTGSGTITKTGAGVATFDSVADGVTVVRAEGEGAGVSCLQDGVLHLNGNEAVVDVPAGQTVEVVSMAEAGSGLGRYTDIVKTGDGTLVLPTGSASAYAKLIVRGGFVNVAAESCFGTSGVALQNGGGIRFLSSFDQTRSRITCTGATTLDVPAGVTLGIHSNYFVSTGATVTKTGLGTWQLKTPFRRDVIPGIDFTGTKWITHEGRMKFTSGDNFCGAGGNFPLVLEAHEGAVLEMWQDSGQHLPLCAVVLRGATMWAGYNQYSTSDAQPVESASRWKGFGLQGPITVLPSRNGEPSSIRANQCHLAHSGGRTVFDVREDATLVVDTMLQPGNRGSEPVCYTGFVKTGGGTLKLLKPVGTQGTLEIRDGTLELGPRMRLNPNIRLDVAPQAKVVLGDGTQITAPADATSALCASADVWFDAASLDLADGAAVGSVANRGTAGGTFTNAKAVDGYQPVAPVFAKAGIGGRGCVAFNGSQALLTTAYTNRGAHVEVFIVSKWTNWSNTGGKGLWGGPFSMTARNPSFTQNGDDNTCRGGLTYQHWTVNSFEKLQTLSLDASFNNLDTGLSVGEAYITHSGRDSDAKKMYTEVWRAAGYAAGTNANITGIVTCDIDAVCVGARTRKGLPQLWGADHSGNRAYIGQIGEVLVFSRKLTDDEIAAVNAYLRRKWFGVEGVSATDARLLASRLNIEVPAGEAAAVVVNGGTVSDATGARLVKSGAGDLRVGGAFADTAFVEVAEGGLALRREKLPPQVDIWMDASNPEGIFRDADGRVTNLVNRGSCGGSFIRNARKSAVPPGPVWNDDGRAENSINGLPALVFDGDSALALFSYTNTVAPRSLHAYCVGVRTLWEDARGRGKWCGPFAFGDLDAKDSDEAIGGVISIQEEPATSGWVDLGKASLGGLSVPATGTPYIFALHSSSNGAFGAYVKADTSLTAVPRKVIWAASEPLTVGVVHLGTRTTIGGGPQWWGKGNEANRCWFGRMGEFIATTEPLSLDQETELFAYLRKKWLNVGDGPATPPVWLTGYAGKPELGTKTGLAMADGTSLEHAADTVTLGALATDGTVSWTRVWEKTAGDAAFRMFDVAEDVALGNIALALADIPSQATVLTYAGTALTTPKWSVSGGPGVGTVSVSARPGVYLLNRLGTMLYLR